MALQLKPTDKILHNYQLTLREFRHASIEHESATRSAFQTLLAELARRRKWQLIPEHPYKLAPGATIRPDATLRDDFSINRGYWEAKDKTHDKWLGAAAPVRLRPNCALLSSKGTSKTSGCSDRIQVPNAIAWRRGRLGICAICSGPNMVRKKLKLVSS